MLPGSPRFTPFTASFSCRYGPHRKNRIAAAPKAPDALRENVTGDVPPRESAPERERQRHRRIDVRAAHSAHGVNRQHDPDGPDDRDLPHALLGPGEHRRVNRAEAE